MYTDCIHAVLHTLKNTTDRVAAYAGEVLKYRYSLFHQKPPCMHACMHGPTRLANAGHSGCVKERQKCKDKKVTVM